MRPIRMFLFAAIFATAAAAAPLDIVTVGAPAINCKFDTDCKITVSDTTAPIALPGATGSGFLQSRTFPPGEAGTAAAGLYAYEYRIDLRNLAGVTALPCVTQLRLAFGPIALVDYNGDGNTDQVWIVTSGGLGTVGPSSASQSGDQITFTFNPPVCAGSSPGHGESSYFFGLASTQPDRHVTAQITYSPGGGTLSLDARAPQLAAGGFALVLPGRIKAGRTIPIRVTGVSPGATVDLYTGAAKGSTQAQSCKGLSVGIGRARIAVSAIAVAKGNAELKLFLPANLRGTAVYLQAVDRSACRVGELLTVKPD
jgi:hypothetical protein